MNKVLLTSAILAAGIANQASAQVWSETFNSGIPATWTRINVDGLTPAGPTMALGFNATIVNALGGASGKAWMAWPRASGDSAVLTVSYFTSPATADRWLISPSFQVTSANTFLTWEDYDVNDSYPDSMQILVSPTAGTTTSAFTTTIYNKAGGSGGFVQEAVSLGTFNGQTIRVAFRDHSTDEYAIFMDNPKTVILPNADAAITSVAPVQGTPFAFTSTGHSTALSGTIENKGAQSLSSYQVNYQQGSNPVVSQTITPGTAVPAFGNSSFSFTTPFIAPASGSYPIKIWVSVPNDADHTNDTSGTTIIAVDSLQPRMSLFEEFTGASCDPCANAVANVDSVSTNNASRLNVIRYHIDIPARDLMYNETSTLVDARSTYYGLSGVPDGQLNGQYIYPGAAGPGTYGSAAVASEAVAGSPFKLSLTATYNASTNTFSFNSTVKSFAVFPAGLVAHAALTVDTIHYHSNISLESLPQTTFPQVVETMIPSSSGTALTAFTAGQTQTVSGTWVKNHPWGDVTGGFAYDSSNTGRMTVWIQDPTSQSVYQSIAVAISNISSTSVNEIIANSDVAIYPNPAKDFTNVEFSILKSSNVKVSVIDMAGRTVQVVADNQMQGAQHLRIPTTSLVPGIYNVVIATEGGTLTQRISVVK